MSDSLRDRIAAIIDREVDGLWEPLEVADAVIAEMGLRHESRFGIDEPGAGYTSFSRHVTDWTVDE
jgi:hypothetical protein